MFYYWSKNRINFSKRKWKQGTIQFLFVDEFRLKNPTDIIIAEKLIKKLDFFCPLSSKKIFLQEQW
ncbi:MAG: hypothetical protein EBS74_00940 [Flavobacteriia bacterium]|nr:hypothetical protein [Flavobacteriia bacterium]